MPFWPIDYC